MRISDWSSDVCSSDLSPVAHCRNAMLTLRQLSRSSSFGSKLLKAFKAASNDGAGIDPSGLRVPSPLMLTVSIQSGGGAIGRSEEHTSELQSLMRISYAVFCLKKKTQTYKTIRTS